MINIELWDILIFLCVIASIYYPTVEGKLCGLIFCSVAILTEVVTKTNSIVGLPYFLCAITIATLGCILINIVQPFQKFSTHVCYMLLVEIALNIFGTVIWWLQVSENISNYVYTSNNIIISPLFLYETTFLIFYAVAFCVLIDRRNRKNAVGITASQFIGDKFLSPYIRFKGSAKWTL